MAARAGQRDVPSRALLWAVTEAEASEQRSVQATSGAQEVVELAKLAGRGRAPRCASGRRGRP